MLRLCNPVASGKYYSTEQIIHACAIVVPMELLDVLVVAKLQTAPESARNRTSVSGEGKVPLNISQAPPLPHIKSYLKVPPLVSATREAVVVLEEPLQRLFGHGGVDDRWRGGRGLCPGRCPTSVLSGLSGGGGRLQRR